MDLVLDGVVEELSFEDGVRGIGPEVARLVWVVLEIKELAVGLVAVDGELVTLVHVRA